MNRWHLMVILKGTNEFLEIPMFSLGFKQKYTSVLMALSLIHMSLK